MYTDENNKIGEHFSVGEELLAEISEMEQKCRAVEKSVGEGYFELREALSAYKVSEIDYVAFFLTQNRKKIKRHSKQRQLFETVNVIISIYADSLKSFNASDLKAVEDIRKHTEASGIPTLIK